MTYMDHLASEVDAELDRRQAAFDQLHPEQRPTWAEMKECPWIPFTHSTHGVRAISMYIPGHGWYDALAATVEAMSAYLAPLSTPELREAMTESYRDSEGAKANLGRVRRLALIMIASEYPSLYVPRAIRDLGLHFDSEDRYWMLPEQDNAAWASADLDRRQAAFDQLHEPYSALVRSELATYPDGAHAEHAASYMVPDPSALARASYPHLGWDAYVISATCRELSQGEQYHDVPWPVVSDLTARIANLGGTLQDRASAMRAMAGRPGQDDAWATLWGIYASLRTGEWPAAGQAMACTLMYLLLARARELASQ